MTLMSRLMARLGSLPPAQTYDVVVDRDLSMRMPDGVCLMASRYSPRHGELRPTILLRTPYGRANFDYVARLFAERGFQVLLQACRGTDGSEGTFDPFRQEAGDGLPTVAWIKQQAWFNGVLALYGPSYLGYAQWSIGPAGDPALKAMVAQMCGPDIRRAIYPGGTLSLDIFLRWALGVGRGNLSPIAAMRIQRNLQRGTDHLPLLEADLAVTGEASAFWSQVVAHAGDDEWWQAQDAWPSVAQVTAPVQLFSGWYDFFAPDVVRLYETLRAAGRTPQLIMGPWAHGSWQLSQHDVREALTWFNANLLGDPSGLRPEPVHLQLLGTDTWQDFPDWPPPGFGPTRWHLQPNGGLALHPAAASAPDQYRYDPADPTPAVGGIGQIRNFGSKDQRKLETRPDVLTYTSAPLDRDLDVIGHVGIELFARSSLQHTDFFACLCDVNPNGHSFNIASGIQRTTPGFPPKQADGSLKLAFELWPTAARFLRGHRIRIQVSSGAHPLFARNLGTSQPLATGTDLRAADQQILHDPEHPSAVLLPIRT